MCEILMAKAISSVLGDSDIADMLKAMVEAGAIHKDGWGVFNENGIALKDGGQMKADSVGVSALSGSNLMVGHLRWATCAMDELTAFNSHPFESGDVVIVHNGIIGNGKEIRSKFGIPVDSPKTDSFVIAWLANHFKQEIGDDYAEIVKRVCSEIGGYYSVFMLDKPSGRLYYFRYDADFTFVLVQGYEDYFIFGATRAERLKTALNLKKTTAFGFDVSDRKVVSKMTPEESTLYEISDDGVIAIADSLPKPSKVLNFYAENLYQTINYGSPDGQYDEDEEDYEGVSVSGGSSFATTDAMLKREDSVRAIRKASKTKGKKGKQTTWKDLRISKTAHPTYVCIASTPVKLAQSSKTKLMTATDEGMFIDEVQRFFDMNYPGVIIKRIFNGNCTIIDRSFCFVGSWSDYFSIAKRGEGFGLISVDAMRKIIAKFEERFTGIPDFPQPCN